MKSKKLVPSKTLDVDKIKILKMHCWNHGKYSLWKIKQISLRWLLSLST